jgi:uncharacterized protein (TIGR00375 family)
MKFIADFHLHSKYSRATSFRSTLENFSKWMEIKGIKVLGTGDFTHPDWFKNLKEKLEEVKPGLFKLKKEKKENYFILTTEVNCVYLKKGRLRKIHLIIFAPSFEVVEKINQRLNFYGDLSQDGRPTLNLDAKELLKIVLEISDDCLVVPSHAWTPWFGIFGSKSGFDSIEECFEDWSKYIYSIETGLSSDPKMNWRLSALDKITLISCSDAHSPEHIGREACVFEGEESSYKAIIEAIKTKNLKPKSCKLIYTIEFFPEEGKYHYDGHRNCGIRLSPKETKKYNGICPVCSKPLTIGVLNRVEQLADRPEGFIPKNAIPFKSLIPLKEIIADALGQGVDTVEVEKEYQNLIAKFENEFNVLLNVQRSDLEKATLPEIVEGIIRVREGKVIIEPGYDGVYGKIRIFSKEEKKESSKQTTLF